MKETIQEIKQSFTKHSKLIFITLIATASTLTFFSPGKINGISMYPTLKDNDFFIETYNFGQKINRFDIVRAETDKSIIKRVIGLPSDVIKISGKELYINGEIQKDTCNSNEQYSGTVDNVMTTDNYEICQENNYTISFSNTGNNEQYLKLKENNQELKLNENEYFLMGDNRLNSTDSREFGTIKGNQIKGIILK